MFCAVQCGTISTIRGDVFPKEITDVSFAMQALFGMHWANARKSSRSIMTTVRYSPEELVEFETLLKARLASAEEDLAQARESLLREGSNGTDDTYFGNRSMDEGNPSLEREELMMLAARQEKYISELLPALARIRAGTYGVCRVTGQLIPKERLRAVPHATLSMNAKLQQAGPAPTQGQAEE